MVQALSLERRRHRTAGVIRIAEFFSMAIVPGARLSPYKVITTLGAGGMGEVYRARDARLSRELAPQPA